MQSTVNISRCVKVHYIPINRQNFRLNISKCDHLGHNKMLSHDIHSNYARHTILSTKYTITFCTISARCCVLLWYNDVNLSAMVSQITGVSIVYPSVYSGADQRKHESSASQAFVRGIHRWPVNSPHKGPVTWKNVSIWWRRHADADWASFRLISLAPLHDIHAFVSRPVKQKYMGT